MRDKTGQNHKNASRIFAAAMANSERIFKNFENLGELNTDLNELTM